MKKLVLLLIISFITLELSPLGIADLKRIHSTEIDATSNALNDLINLLLTKEYEIWQGNIPKKGIRNVQYPNPLTSDDVKKLTDAITKLNNLQDPREIRRYNPFARNTLLSDIFNTIRDTAISKINAPTDISPYLSKYGYWKPITQRYFQLAKGIIQSFSQSIKIAYNTQVGDVDHYFIAANRGEALRMP